ncbi:MAG: Slp family lipoprotein [Deltaproteobacteria bacterium]|nr:Slp family lipoprotein [Deltaproteobacteria bacterium]MBI3755655.1 Slp family lipoprotein [Deltaproteobacteria bacterium]
MRYKLFTTILIFLTGCSVISKDIRCEVDRTITLPMVQANPDALKGKKVIWGGIILSSKNLAEKTVIEVLQTPLDRTDMATDKEQSQGRFFVESPSYVDTFLYKAGKEITVAGIIKGAAIQKIGEMDYTYPILEPLQIRVFEPYKEPAYQAPPPWPPWWYNPYYPYPNRYYDPYYPPR